MKPARMLAPCLAAIMASAAAQDERRLFDTLDENRDGFLSSAELERGAAPQRGGWVAMDRDGDGRISPAEFDGFVRERPARSPAAGASQPPARVAAGALQASNMIGTPVSAPGGKTLGSIAGLLLDSRRGGVHYVLLAVADEGARGGEKLFAYPLNALRRRAGELTLSVPARNLELAPGYQGRAWPEPQWRDADRYVRAQQVIGAEVVDPIGNRVGRLADLEMSLASGATERLMVDFDDGGVLPMPPHALRLGTGGPLVLDWDASRRS